MKCLIIEIDNLSSWWLSDLYIAKNVFSVDSSDRNWTFQSEGNLKVELLTKSVYYIIHNPSTNLPRIHIQDRTSTVSSTYSFVIIVGTKQVSWIKSQYWIPFEFPTWPRPADKKKVSNMQLKDRNIKIKNS